MMKRKNKGFSLVELLIAIAILAIIMVALSGMLSSTLVAQRKTKKAMQMQTESQRIYSQLSDLLMQATYVRVEAENKNLYTYDRTDKKCSVDTSKTLTSVNLVPDNYANYQLGAKTDERKVIVDFDTGQLYTEKNKTYPEAGNEIDTSDTDVISFRALTKESSVEGMEGVYEDYYYVQPKYIYVEYSSDKLMKSYAIIEYDNADKTLRMYRPETGFAETDVPSASVNFEVAKSELASHTDDGLLSSYAKDFYLTANPDENSITFFIALEDPKYKGYGYHLNESVNIRNSNVLSVKPQLLKKKTKTTTP